MKLEERTVTGHQMHNVLVHPVGEPGVLGRILGEPLTSRVALPLAMLAKILQLELAKVEKSAGEIVVAASKDGKVETDKVPSVKAEIEELYAAPRKVQLPNVRITAPEFTVSAADILMLEGLVSFEEA